MFKTHIRFGKSLILISTLGALFPALADAANIKNDKMGTSSLIITSDPLPENLRQQLYSTPSRARDVTSSEITGRNNFPQTETLVTRKVSELTNNLAQIQQKFSSLSDTLSNLQRVNQQQAADYYANVATINTQLQAGTTPGNPRLVGRLKDAESQLKTLGDSVTQLNGVAVEGASLSSEAGFLLEETRAAYSLSGAVEEDHVKLAEVEDSINNTMVLIDRILNTVSDDITRTSTYMSSERNNLRALTLSVTNGDLYGKSLTNRPFSSAATYNGAPSQSASPAGQKQPQGQALSGPRPLAKIKFDRPDVNYEQPVYMAVNEAMQRYPNARFDLVAVHPSKGNAAEVAIESTKSRRNAEKVLRTLTQMGLPMEKIDLSYNEDPQATSSEVQIFVK